jgi:hypothetical protein
VGQVYSGRPLLGLAIQSQSHSHITTDNQSASPSWCQAPIWDPRPIFLSPRDFLLDSCRFLAAELCVGVKLAELGTVT